MRIHNTHQPCGQSLCAGLWFTGHLRIHLGQLFQPFGVVLKAAADVDAFEDHVVAVVGGAQVFGHLFGVVEARYGGGEVRLAGEEDVFSAGSQVGLVLFGQGGDGEGFPAQIRTDLSP